MNDLIKQIALCIEYGKINRITPYPADMKDQDRANELTKKALDNGIKPTEILENALIPAMAVVGNEFSRNEIYVPQMLMSTKAMHGAMVHIKPYFLSGETKRKGTFINGTVSGPMCSLITTRAESEYVKQKCTKFLFIVYLYSRVILLEILQ